ncbi:unnamed protein product [Cylicostephanus goldi]|uniref:Uncharacterized protein n=1 Tax=Cylicostephanus goldi TaxID=71465 RepID=A0A3P6RR33_CYLGO|nr:unnamed protein product [Cylicostephanus goldi]
MGMELLPEVVSRHLDKKQSSDQIQRAVRRAN